ncbi:unnamed protein product [Oppiella nova]|uniref:Calcyclin-binding protein n=1 Tax=Oppiella nova TaxID=334625 RepID=A0A7R9M962_9ACAR|nr:unnamed protein product [Oppiella nova]CAG2172821.1 unnamed protein product [Oppiella nova]
MAAQLKKDIEDMEFDLSDLSSLELMAKRQHSKALLSQEIQRLTQRKNQLVTKWREEAAAEALLKSGDDSNSASVPVTQGSATSGQQAPMGSVVVTNYMWDQTDDFCKIYVEIDKNYALDATHIQMSFPSKRSLSVVFGKYKFTISRLFGDVSADQSYHRLTKSHKLIKQMYDEGDDDMKRTIAKSWYESRNKTSDVDMNEPSI